MNNYTILKSIFARYNWEMTLTQLVDECANNDVLAAIDAKDVLKDGEKYTWIGNKEPEKWYLTFTGNITFGETNHAGRPIKMWEFSNGDRHAFFQTPDALLEFHNDMQEAGELVGEPELAAVIEDEDSSTIYLPLWLLKKTVEEAN